MALDGFAFTALTNELDQLLAGSRLEQTAVRDYYHVLNFRAPGKSLALAFSIIVPPHGMFINNHLAGETERNAFTHTLENNLAGMFCTGMSSPPFERWATMGFCTEPGQQPSLLLHVELMGRNNHLTLCQQNIVITTTRRGNINQSGHSFRPPPDSDKLNPLQLNSGLLHGLIVNQGTKPVARSLIALVRGIGPLLAAELLHRCQLPDDLPSAQLTEKQADALSQEILKLTEAATQGHAAPMVYPSLAQAEHWYWQPLQHLSLPGESAESISQAQSAYCQWQYSTKGLEKFRSRLHISVESATARLRRTLEKQKVELARAQNFQQDKEKADTILANLHLMQKGQSKAVLTNPHNAQPLELTMDPRLSPSANAQLLYRKSSRLKKADNKIARQMNRVKDEIQYLNSVAYSLEQAESKQELEEIRQEMISQGLLKHHGPTKRKTPKPLFSQLRTPEGELVLVGKNNRQNEQLTLRQANKEHIWLHVKDYPGSHTVLCTDSPSQESLLFAASAAAWHSKARDNAKVEVVWTKVKHVKKIPGSAPGRVHYSNYQSLIADPGFHRQTEDGDTR